MQYLRSKCACVLLLCLPLGAQPEDDVESWRQLMRSGNDLREAGRLQEAALQFEAARKLAETFPPLDGRSSATRNAIGSVLTLSGDYNSAIQAFDQAIRLHPPGDGVPPGALLEILSNKAHALRRAGRLDEAEATLEQAVALEAPHLGPGEFHADSVLHGMGWVALERGRYAEALTAFQQELRILEQRHAPLLLVAAVLGSLGHLHDKRGDYLLAEACYRRAWGLRRKALPPGHVDVYRTMASLAAVLIQAAKYERAEALLRQALSGLERNPQAHEVDNAAVIGNLAVVLTETRRYKEAEPLAQRALTIYARHGLGESSQALSVMQTFAMILSHRKHPQAAERTLLDIVAILQRRQGETHPELVRPRLNLAILYMRLKRYSYAENQFLTAIGLAQSKLGPAHNDLAILLSSYSQLLKATKRSRESAEVRERAMAVAAGARADLTGASMVDVRELSLK